MSKFHIDEKSVSQLFCKSDNKYKTKSRLISNMILINGKSRAISYNIFYFNKEQNKIFFRLYTVTTDCTEYIEIAENTCVNIYVKDLLLCIDIK